MRREMFIAAAAAASAQPWGTSLRSVQQGGAGGSRGAEGEGGGGVLPL